MMYFDCSEVPVACSMINAAQQCGTDPFHSYMCYWIAFNNIYVTITDKTLAQQGGQRVKLKEQRDGTIKTKPIANVNVPDTYLSASEYQQIEYARQNFSPQLIHDLILHSSTQFFVNRIPNGKEGLLKRTRSDKS